MSETKIAYIERTDDEEENVSEGQPLFSTSQNITGRSVPKRIKRLVHGLFSTSSYENLRGYQLEGHKCISELDKRLEKEMGGSLLYGEVLPEGVDRLLDNEHLDVASAKVLYDFGMGTGKLCLQVFLEHMNLEHVVGIEISPSRFKIGAQALRRLSERRGFALVADSNIRCKVLQITPTKRRTLEFRCGDAFSTLHEKSDYHPEVSYVGDADIILLNTDFPTSCNASICELLCCMAQGSRTASFSDLKKMFNSLNQKGNKKFPVIPYPNNHIENDRFRTTWSPRNGHHFYLWHMGPIKNTRR